MHAHEMCSHIIQILIPETALSIYWRLGNHIQQQKVVLSIKPRCRFCGLLYSKSSIVYAHISCLLWLLYILNLINQTLLLFDTWKKLPFYKRWKFCMILIQKLVFQATFYKTWKKMFVIILTWMLTFVLYSTCFSIHLFSKDLKERERNWN